MANLSRRKEQQPSDVAEMSEKLKERGNAFYKSRKYVEALDCYEQALHCADVSHELQGKLHNNKAACFLQLEDFNQVIKETKLCLKFFPRNTKALYRKCQAHKYLGQIILAYEDLVAMRIQPTDKQSGKCCCLCVKTRESSESRPKISSLRYRQHRLGRTIQNIEGIL